MQDATQPVSGIELLVEQCRTAFRSPENTQFYSRNDFKRAERKFIKLCLNGEFDPMVEAKNRGIERVQNVKSW
jgi:hypothetical protein